jgi:hypothetical protein
MSGYDAAILSTAMLEHPDLVRLPRGVRLLYVEALVWSKLHRTDGQIVKHMLRRVSDEPNTDAAAAALVGCGRWTDEGEAWRIVGYLDQQWSAERVAKNQAQARVRYERMMVGRANAVTNAVTNDTDLTRSDPKGKIGRSVRSGIVGLAADSPARTKTKKTVTIPCPRCDMTLRSASGLNSHLRTHAPLCRSTFDPDCQQLATGNGPYPDLCEVHAKEAIARHQPGR